MVSARWAFAPLLAYLNYFTRHELADGAFFSSLWLLITGHELRAFLEGEKGGGGGGGGGGGFSFRFGGEEISIALRE